MFSSIYGTFKNVGTFKYLTTALILLDQRITYTLVRHLVKKLVSIKLSDTVLNTTWSSEQIIFTIVKKIQAILASQTADMRTK